MRLKEPLIVYLKKLGVQGEAGREEGEGALEDDEINFNSRYPPSSIFTRAYGLSSDALFLRGVNNLFLIIDSRKWRKCSVKDDKDEIYGWR